MTGPQLRERRRKLGLGQTELAAKLDVDPVTVSRWERGVHAIPRSVALVVEAMKPARKRGAKRRR